MSNYQFTNKAVEDLTDIWDYTSENWSEEQADKYYFEIINVCEEIAENKRSGKYYSNLIENLKGVKVNKHIIFYREITNELIEIERILHEKMDLKSKLTEK